LLGKKGKTGVHIHQKHDSRVKRLPKPIQEYMKARFKLLPEYLTLMRCFEYQGTVGNKEVSRVSIFSPANATEKHLMIITRKDLEQHPEMLLFEGYIDSQGKAYVADRRVPVKTGKAAHSSLTT
jgi:hypothetical protein